MKAVNWSSTELVILNAALDIFRPAKTEDRARIISGTTEKIEALRKDKSSGKQADIEPKIRKFLYNNSRKAKKPSKTYQKPWTARMVFAQEEREEIIARAKSLSGDRPGGHGYLGSHQTAAKELFDGLSAAKVQEYETLAIKWNSLAVPADVQLKLAKKGAVRHIKEFSEHMFKTMGTRLFIMSAAVNENGDVDAAWHDFNDELGGGDTFPSVQPGWNKGPVMTSWMKYAEASFSGEVKPAELKKGSKVRLPVEMARNEHGLPIIPPGTPKCRQDMDSILRQFIGGYQNLASGTQLPVTWIALAGDREQLVDDMYMPADGEFKDPSRMSLLQGMPMLEFWRDREDKGLTPFEFHHYRTRDGTYHKAVKLASDVYSSRTKGKGRTTEKAMKKPAPVLKERKKAVPLQKKRRLRGRSPSEVSTEDSDEDGGKDSDEDTDEDAEDDSEEVDDDDEVMNEEQGEEIEESFTDVLKSMDDLDDLDESMDVGPSRAPGHTLKIPGTSPADVRTGSSRLDYLRSLCTRPSYRDMLEAIFSQPASPTQATVAGVPAFGTWSYNSPCLPEAFHGSKTQINNCLEWLLNRPHCNEAGRYLGRSHGEAVALVIGLLLQDMYKIQFSGEPDEDADESIPQFIQSSKLQFSTVDGILLPQCDEITACVWNSANSRSTLNSTLFPLEDDGMINSPKMVTPPRVVKEKKEPAKRKGKTIPGKKRPAPVQPIEEPDEESKPAKRKGKIVRVVESDDEPHTPEPAKKKGKTATRRRVPVPAKDTIGFDDEPHTPKSVPEQSEKKGKDAADAPSRTQPKRANKEVTWTKTPSGLKKVKGRTE